VIEQEGARLTVIAGTAYGKQSPVGVVWPTFYVDVDAKAGTTIDVCTEHEERAIYVVEGSVDIAGDIFEGPRLLIFRPGDAITVTAVTPAKLMLLGGDAMDGPRIIWWNFVSSSKERLEQAKEDWAQGRFKPVPGETEFIPLPEK